MRRAEIVALGLLQGPAELLPISSSAHVGLLIARRHPGLRGAERKELEVALHAGTALALAVGERRRPRGALLAPATPPPAGGGVRGGAAGGVARGGGGPARGRGAAGRAGSSGGGARRRGRLAGSGRMTD